MNPLLTKNFLAEAAVTARRIVKYGTADGKVLHADGVSAAMLGVTGELGQATAGGRVDVHTHGLAEVEYGGTVTRGDRLTSDANGKAIAAPAGIHCKTVGTAHVSGVSGDIGVVRIAPADVEVVQKTPLTMLAADLQAASAAVYRVVTPVAGTIKKVWSALAAALATGDATITLSINGTPVTGGVITIAESGSAAGDVDSAAPTAANVVAAGDVIEATIAGANTANVGALLTLDIEA